MFDYVLNTPLTIVVIEIWVEREPISLIRMKNQQKTKALLNDRNVVNVEQWTKMYSARVATQSKPWNTL